MRQKGRLSTVWGVLLLVLTLSAPLQAGKKPSKVALAIVIDEATYNATAASVQRYADAVVRYNRKPVEILVGQWTAQAVRDTLQALWQTRQLEGAVLVGEIPIPMIRRAHHLCTAFKMNPSWPVKRSSVPSDRFYDDFDLQFNFLEQDGDLVYYELSPEGAQRVRCNIYTARIKPSKTDPDHSFTELIAEFLDRAAAVKAQAEPLDKVFHFGGHGNSSESLQARIDEERAYYEQFGLQEPEGQVRFVHYSDEKFPRKRLLSALSDPTVDFAHLHTHGGIKAQYISKDPYTFMAGEHLEKAKEFFRGKMRDAKDKEKTAAQLKKTYGIPDSFLEGWDDPAVSFRDSVRSASVDIVLQDLDGYKSGAKVILLDACFNGAFLHDDYVAARYAFGHGSRTMAVTANSVNIIQDHWKNELAGMLAAGVCVGEWARQYQTLESHLFGDPTFQFAPTHVQGVDMTLAKDIHDGKYTPWDCLDLLQTSRSLNVRLEAFYYLIREADSAPLLAQAIRTGLDDSYEMVRRMAARYASTFGDPALLPVIARHYLDPLEGARVRYHLTAAFAQYSYSDVLKALRDGWNGIWPEPADFDNLLARLQRSAESTERELADITRPEANAKDRASTISAQRNACLPGAIYPMVKLVKDSSAPQDLRLKAAEALGWYTLSFYRQQVYDDLRGYPADDPAVADEVRRTLRRLEDNAHTK